MSGASIVRISIAILLPLALSYALSLKCGCATVRYDERIYPIPTFKTIHVDLRSQGYATLVCGNTTYHPTSVGENVTFNLIIEPNTRCKVIILCNNNKVVKQPLTFKQVLPEIGIEKANFNAALKMYLRLHLPLPGTYVVSVNLLGHSRLITVKTKGDSYITREVIFPLKREILELYRGTLNVIVSLWVNDTLLFSKTITLQPTDNSPILTIGTRQLVNGINTFCFTLINRGNTPLQNVTVGFIFPFGQLKTTKVGYVAPRSSKTLCFPVTLSLPTILVGYKSTANNITTGGSESLSMNATIQSILEYSINNTWISRVSLHHVQLVSMSWPTIALVATEPPVPREGSVFKMLIYLSNPSPITFYNVRVSVVPRGNTLLTPVTSPYVVIGTLQPMTSVPLTLFFRLDKCDVPGTINAYVVIEAHTPYASKITKIPITLPASCNNSVLFPNDANMRASKHYNTTSTTLVVLSVAILVMIILRYRKKKETDKRA